MSIPPVTSSGAYPDALVNNSRFVNTLDGGSEKPTTATKPSSGMAALNKDRIDQITKEAELAMKEGRVQDIVILSKEQGGFINSGSSVSDGKTIVKNKGQGLIIGSTFTDDGQMVYTSFEANRDAEKGAPTHGFFYHDFDFLSKAAEEYATLGENEEFLYRNINDVNLVRDTLDFFKNGNYSTEEVNQLQQQMTDVVKELAKQLKNGETIDFSKVESKLSIGGADVTIGQLMDFQKIGGELKETFDNITVGSSVNTLKYSQMGIAKAVGNLYGSDKGELGQMFSDAIDRLYEKGKTEIKRNLAAANQLESGYSKGWSPREKDAVATGLEIADTFSDLDISSKESFSKDFTGKLSAIQSLVQKHCDEFGISSGHVGLAGDIAETTKYIQSWLDRI